MKIRLNALIVFLLLALSAIFQIGIAYAAEQAACSRDVIQLIELFANGMKRRAWLRTPYEHPATDALVRKVLSYSPEERVAAVNALIANGRLNSIDQKLVRLCLYDETEWLNLFRNFSQLGGKTTFEYDAFFLHGLYPVIKEMPEDLSQRLMLRVKEMYIESMKSPRKINKRIMDAFIRTRVPADEIINKALSKGATPLQAYGQYLNSINKIFEGTSVGRYTADDVLAISEIIQKWATSVPPTEFSRGYEMRIFFFGSTPSGRAVLNGVSDIDLAFSSHRHWLSFEPHVKELNDSIARYLKQRGLAFQEVQFSQPQPGMASKLTPVQIEITPEKIEFALYSEPESATGLYNPPKRFELKSEKAR